MRNVLMICTTMLAVGAAGLSAQAAQQPANAHKQAATATTTRQSTAGKALAKGHRQHTNRRHAAAAKKATSMPAQTAVKQTQEAKEDLNAAEKHVNKAEAAEKKAEAKTSAKTSGTRHARRSTHRRTTTKKMTSSSTKKAGS